MLHFPTDYNYDYNITAFADSPFNFVPIPTRWKEKEKYSRTRVFFLLAAVSSGSTSSYIGMKTAIKLE